MPASWLAARWLIVDTETTGLDPATDRVVEVACVWATPIGPQTAFRSLVDPERPIPATASAIHHWDGRPCAGRPDPGGAGAAARDPVRPRGRAGGPQRAV